MKKLFNIAITLCLISFSYLAAERSMVGQDDYLESACNCCPGTSVFLACPSCTFDVEFNALYLQPSGSGLHYMAEAVPLPLPSPNWKIRDIRPNYHFGFDIGASAICHDRNTNVKLNYVHFFSKDSASKTVSSSNMVGPFFEIGPDASPYSKAKGRVTYHYDALNLDYGVCVQFGDYLHTNFFVGAEAVSIEQGLTTNYSNSNNTISRNIKVPSSFKGLGPQIGLNFSYDVWCGLQLTGKSTAALLVGELKNHTTYKSYSPLLKALDITPPNTQTTRVHHRTGVVPAFEGKLGLAYSFATCRCTFDLDVGYEVLLYINAIQSVDMGSEVVTPPVVPDIIGVFARTFQRTTSNFALAGPYLKFNIGF